MADVRRHMVRKAHVNFLRLCPTCNETFMDKNLFESAHGYGGQYCNINKKQHRGEAADAQWHRLYGMIFDKVHTSGATQPPNSCA